jgi:alcohol dehydrogenase
MSTQGQPRAPRTVNRAAELYFCPYVLFGAGALEQVGDLARGFGSKALVVTDKGLVQAGIAQAVQRGLGRGGLETILFDGVSPNPSALDVQAGLQSGAGQGIELIVSVGGGSAHDCAKAIALVASNGGQIADYEGFGRSAHAALPVVAVNTTAGSGAEMSRFAVITDPERRLKMIIADSHLTPRAAVNDPETTLSLPPALTAASGLDALTHAVEAYVSTAASPFTDLCALEAVRLVYHNLERAYRQGGELEAREAVMYGSVLAAFAFNSASVGAAHALAHPLGAVYDLPHGVCNGILLPLVTERNLPAAMDRYEEIGRVMGLGRGPLAARSVVRALHELGQRVGLPSGLAKLGVQRERLPEMAARAAQDMCLATNPVAFSQDELVELYSRAM